MARGLPSVSLGVGEPTIRCTERLCTCSGCDELERRHPGALLRPTVVGQRQHRHDLILSVLVVFDVRPQLPHDGPVIPSHLAVRLRTIRRGVPVGDPEERADPSEERGAELGAIVGKHRRWGSVYRHPVVKEGCRDGFRVDPLKGDGPRHLGEAIHDDQPVFISRRLPGEGPEQVHTKIRKRFFRGEGLQVAHLASLADVVPCAQSAVGHQGLAVHHCTLPIKPPSH